MQSAPVLLLIFNRPECTKRVFDAIRLARPPQLFVAADGPRDSSPDDLFLCEKARDIVQGVDWPCEVCTLFRSRNLGCRAAVSSAINWFFQRVDSGIILEDDCVPDVTFFLFCSLLLEKYRNDKHVLSIGGSNLGYSGSLDASYGATAFMNMWGWATWADRAARIDYQMTSWGTPSSRIALYLNLLRCSPKRYALEYGWYRYWSGLFTSVKEMSFDTWDYQWVFFGLRGSLISIFPHVNLISNTGYGETATHTTDSDNALADRLTTPMTFPLRHPKTLKIDKEYELNCVRARWHRYRSTWRSDLKLLLADCKELLSIRGTIRRYARR